MFFSISLLIEVKKSQINTLISRTSAVGFKNWDYKHIWNYKNTKHVDHVIIIIYEEMNLT